MVFKKKNNYANEDESKNWNNSKRYSENKIMEHLEEIDEYEIESEFGFKNPQLSLENSNLSQKEINYRKIEAFKFMVAKLRQILSNSDFAISRERSDFDKYSLDLELIESITPKLYKKISKNEVNLNKNYPIILNLVKQIKKKINHPLNKNSLIYKTVEEVDIEEQINADREDFRNNP